MTDPTIALLECHPDADAGLDRLLLDIIGPHRTRIASALTTYRATQRVLATGRPVEPTAPEAAHAASEFDEPIVERPDDHDDTDTYLEAERFDGLG